MTLGQYSNVGISNTGLFLIQKLCEKSHLLRDTTIPAVMLSRGKKNDCRSGNWLKCLCTYKLLDVKHFGNGYGSPAYSGHRIQKGRSVAILVHPLFSARLSKWIHD